MSGDHVIGESRTDTSVTLPHDQESGTEWLRVDMNRQTDTLSLVVEAMKKQSERRGEKCADDARCDSGFRHPSVNVPRKNPVGKLPGSPEESPSFTVQAKFA